MIVSVDVSSYATGWRMRRDACFQEECDFEAGLGCAARPADSDFEAAEVSCGSEQDTFHDSLQMRTLGIDKGWEDEHWYFADFGVLRSFQVERLASGGVVLAWLHEGAVGVRYPSLVDNSSGWGWQGEPIVTAGANSLSLVANDGQQTLLFVSREDSLQIGVLVAGEGFAGAPYEVLPGGTWNGGPIEVVQLGSGTYLLAVGGNLSGCQDRWDVWRLSERLDSATHSVSPGSLLGNCIGVVSMDTSPTGAIAVWDEWKPCGFTDSATQYSKLWVQLFDLEGRPHGESVSFPGEEKACYFAGCLMPSVATLGDAGFVVVWHSGNLDSGNAKARLLGTDLSPVGEPFLLNLRGEVVSHIAVASAPSREEFMAVWTACPYGPSPFEQNCEPDAFGPVLQDCAIFGQRFNRFGGRLWGRCNDGTCGEGEDCHSCPKDCGLCDWL